MIIGLTGIMGAGKSTAASLLSEIGLLICSSDDIVHDLLENDYEVQQALTDRFGQELHDLKGQINREFLSKHVFSDIDALEWLEGLLHPKVSERRNQLIAKQPEEDWVLEIPLLFEKKLEKLCDFSVCISVGAATQMKRLQNRGLSSTTIQKRISRQWPQCDKEKAADFIIYNNGSLNFLKQQLDALVSGLRSQ